MSEPEEVQNAVEENTVATDETKEEDTATGSHEADEISLADLNLNASSMPSSILGRRKDKPQIGSGLITGNKRETETKKTREDEDASLFEWCEQFSFSPGIEYLQLVRNYPKLWEGISTAGFIEDIYEPIDEHYISDKWGGGTYTLTAYQKDATGRTRKGKHKDIEISGVPHSFVGGDGYPHPLPKKHTSNRSSDVLRRRVGMGRFGRDEEPSRSMHDEPRNLSPVDKGSRGASELYKTLNESRKNESDALSVLKEAQNQVAEQMRQSQESSNQMYKQMIESQKEEMRRLRDETKNSAENQTKPFTDMIQFLAQSNNSSATREQLDALRATHDKAISTLQRENRDRLDDLRKAYESRQAQLVDELNRVRGESSSLLDKMRIEYLDKERSAKDDAFRLYQTQVENLRTQNDTIRQQYKDQSDEAYKRERELRDDFRDRMAAVKDDHDKYVREQERRYKDMISELREEKRDMKSEINTEKQEYYNKTKEDFETKLATQKEMLEKVYVSKIEALEERLRRTEELFREKEETIKKEAERDKKSALFIMEQTKRTDEKINEVKNENISSQLKEAQKQANQYRRELDEARNSGDSNDPFHTLSKVEQLKEQLRDLGFKSNDDDTKEKEEVPKDFMGKVAHYGPKIIAPILQRVDAATSALEQHNQQAAHSQIGGQHMLMHQDMMQQENARASMLRQRREEIQRRRQQRVESTPPVPAYVAPNPIYSPPPQPQPNYEAMQQPDVYEVEVVDEAQNVDTFMEENIVDEEADMSGYERLANHISKKMAEGASAQTVANELLFAKMTGIIPKDVFKEVVNADFEDTFNKLKEHDKKLATPRARIFLSNVLKGVKS